ncbi:MAG: squalene synthase HpnC [Phenylobacterium sp.]|uniref:squalene synthase HpnC n=1 Tax=Phenylobacterium sp. TaxID=1871053 RepID=UPI0026240CC7|nr:squalene synthase HpnC [Phenylobacterium sp.]MDB5500096.1 squalene synthase HpnC [Phenylobacterium sp.]
MSDARDLLSGKGARDENFPVASILIEARFRPTIMAFYRFARTADDVADHASANAAEKLHRLSEMRGALMGDHDRDTAAVALRHVLAGRGLPVVHGLDLLEAFRRDVVQSRYANWDALMDYCRYSAAPVGRMVLDIHGESPGAWAASDALCAALQVINHLQDCGQDYRELDRVYLPEEDLSAVDEDVTALAAPRASAGLRLVIAGLARRTQELLHRSRPLADQVRSRRLQLEIAVIQRLAEDLARRLIVRDPLSERVHHRRLELFGLTASAIVRVVRPARPPRNLIAGAAE